MAVNKDASHRLRHALLIGASGSGKSQAIKNLIPTRGVRVVAFDPDEDHDCHGFDTLPRFAKELAKADRSGKNYRLSYTGATEPEQFETFCQCVWEVLDGRRLTYIILEEAAQFTESSGPALAHLRNLMLRSRKYGGIVFAVGQQSTEVPTTVRKNTRHKYIGLPENPDDAKVSARLIGVRPEQVMEIEPDTLTFWHKESGRDAEKVQFKYLG